MNNKVLVKLIVPELSYSCDVYLPVNEVVWKIKRMLLKVISDFTKVDVEQNLECILLNKKTCEAYNNNDVIIQTNIRNGTELLLITNLN